MSQLRPLKIQRRIDDLAGVDILDGTGQAEPALRGKAGGGGRGTKNVENVFAGLDGYVEISLVLHRGVKKRAMWAEKNTFNLL